jgi:PPOX class probable FMN-dependent enzyme
MTPTTLHGRITSVAALQAIIGIPGETALKKQLDRLDAHCRRFIALAPLLFISSAGADGRCDVSPKGDAPGFVRVLGERLVAIPERVGNRRIDTLYNVLQNPHVGLLFVIPGVRETLRVNGCAGVYRDHELLETMTHRGKTPLVALCVEIEEVFLHCGRSLVRSGVWEPDTWPPLDRRPRAGHIFSDHVGLVEVTCEVVEQSLEEAYTTTLY